MARPIPTSLCARPRRRIPSRRRSWPSWSSSPWPDANGRPMVRPHRERTRGHRRCRRPSSRRRRVRAPSTCRDALPRRGSRRQDASRRDHPERAFEEGSLVRKGDVLFRIDAAVYRAEVTKVRRSASRSAPRRCWSARLPAPPSRISRLPPCARPRPTSRAPGRNSPEPGSTSTTPPCGRPSPAASAGRSSPKGRS